MHRQRVPSQSRKVRKTMMMSHLLSKAPLTLLEPRRSQKRKRKLPRLNPPRRPRKRNPRLRRNQHLAANSRREERKIRRKSELRLEAAFVNAHV